MLTNSGGFVRRPWREGRLKLHCCFAKMAVVYHSLLQPLNLIQGIGSAIEKRLRARGIDTVGDLLLHLPKDYIDDRQIVAIKALVEGVEARIRGRITGKSARGFGRKRQVTMTLTDSDDARITLNFFHSGYMMSDARLSEGREISVRGTPERWGGRLQMNHPEWIVSEQFRPGWHPRYASLAGLGGKRIEGMIRKALSLIPPAARVPLDTQLTEHPPLIRALSLLHLPDGEGVDSPRFRMSVERIKLEELLIYLQLMQEKRREAETEAPAFASGREVAHLVESLPSPLTDAQQHVWQEISADLASGRRMHRLLQGDVGAGKTWVAAMAMASVFGHGMQSALMAPTEVLATQHHRTLTSLLKPLGINIELLTGSSRATERKRILQALADGSLHCVVGTHALISGDVTYNRLGLALVDEQHRFGVRQRWALAGKGGDAAVHLLGMTATPIPRSLALSLYGDMDLSIMRGMPPGRKPVETRVIDPKRMGSLADGMQRILDGSDAGRGGRIYWIVPRIDEEEDGISVAQRVEALSQRFPDEKVLGLHGRMKAAEKNSVLKAFSDGECRILVSTTVVEVGVDVPEARLIVIEQAEQYGLAQLHQLRGRVGRSSEQGYCILLPGREATDGSTERLNHLVTTHDGLKLAEADLKMRGSGDAVGVRQSGSAGFRLLDSVADTHLILQWHAIFDGCVVDDAMVRFWRPEADSVD
ncbi:MAG: ATP-dependent DNA helicase RecG [Mariprofundaceae bacterium]|nr:ATP-dependent DNA helicase RecG [Mariprofundaceae bacterium]